MVFGFDLSFVLFVAAAFLAVVLLLEGLWLLWSSRHGPQARRLAQRLRVLTTEPAAAAAAGDATRARAAGAFPALQAMLARRAAGLALEDVVDELVIIASTKVCALLLQRLAASVTSACG